MLGTHKYNWYIDGCIYRVGRIVGKMMIKLKNKRQGKPGHARWFVW
jgi:hypothetical protein